MAKKRFHWLKLREGFFQQKEMKKLRKMAGGDTYTIIYLKLQLVSLRNNGVIIFENIGDNMADELSLELDEALGDVQMTLLFLKQHGLIDELSTDEFLLPEALGNMGEESESAARVRKHRERMSHAKNIPALQCNAHVTNSNENVTLEIEKNLEKEIAPPLPPRGESERSGEGLAVEMAVEAGPPVDLPTTLTERFEAFWAVYPRKSGKGAAEKAWQKINPSGELVAVMLAAVEAAKRSDQWKRDAGRYIPAPAKWLREQRWLDKLADTRPGEHRASYDLQAVQELVNSENYYSSLLSRKEDL